MSQPIDIPSCNYIPITMVQLVLWGPAESGSQGQQRGKGHTTICDPLKIGYEISHFDNHSIFQSIFSMGPSDRWGWNNIAPVDTRHLACRWGPLFLPYKGVFEELTAWRSFDLLRVMAIRLKIMTLNRSLLSYFPFTLIWFCWIGWQVMWMRLHYIK